MEKALTNIEEIKKKVKEEEEGGWRKIGGDKQTYTKHTYQKRKKVSIKDRTREKEKGKK